MIRFIIYMAAMVFALSMGNIALAVAIGIVGLVVCTSNRKN